MALPDRGLPAAFSLSASLPALARRFASFSDAARENADSRVMAGLHFRFATDAGLQLGRQVGTAAATQILPPLVNAAGGSELGLSEVTRVPSAN